MGKSAWILPFFVGLTNTAAWAEPPVCDSADHCVWIMENHGPHEFDYSVLVSELEGFGADGKEFLIMLVGDKDADIAGRSMDILADGNFNLNRDEANEIVKTWPGSNVEKLGRLMAKIGSPFVQSRMIETLTHKDKKVRRESRRVLASMRRDKKIYQLRGHEHGPLAKAVLEAPTREIVQMLAAYSPDKTKPFLQRALKTGDSASVIAAYDALYKIDKEMAFAALLQTLREIETPDQAFAIGALLRHRHKGREDGFYLDFGKELAEDPKMSLMGRVAGLDTILGGHVIRTPKSPVQLTTSPHMMEAWSAAIAGKTALHPYERNFPKVFEGNHADWATMLWGEMKSKTQLSGSAYREFFTTIEDKENIAFKRIVLEALSQTDNIKILKYALNSVITQNDKIYLGSVENLTQHWSDEVRSLAQTAKRVLDGNLDPKDIGGFSKAYKQIRDQNAAQAKACRAKGSRPEDYVIQLPYFTLQEEVPGSPIKRRHISSAYPTKPGWFVGFETEAQNGGLYYYDNETGLGEAIEDIPHVSAVLPMRIPAKGRFTSDFWVISADPGTDEGRLYRVSQKPDGFMADFYRFLPKNNFKVSVLSPDSYLLSHKDQSPLILLANGRIKPACE